MKLYFVLFTVLLLVSLSSAQEKQKSCDMKCKNTQSCSDNQTKTDNNEQQKTENIVVVNKVCPVSGEELKKVNFTFTYKEKTYGFCCKNCLTKVKADPEKYLANLNDDGTYKKK